MREYKSYSFLYLNGYTEIIDIQVDRRDFGDIRDTFDPIFTSAIDKQKTYSAIKITNLTDGIVVKDRFVGGVPYSIPIPSNPEHHLEDDLFSI